MLYGLFAVEIMCSFNVFVRFVVDVLCGVWLAFVLSFLWLSVAV